MFERVDNINKKSFLSEASIKLGLKPTHHAEQHPEIYEAMQELAHQDLGIKSTTFLMGAEIRKAGLSGRLRHQDSKRHML
eukprot:1618842-Amphidinium_carterae.3